MRCLPLHADRSFLRPKWASKKTKKLILEIQCDRIGNYIQQQERNLKIDSSKTNEIEIE
jgi:hypothetical protein